MTGTIRPWAVMRRIQYGVGFFLFWFVIGVTIYYAYFYQAPNCFDLAENGNERGVDCGGDCVRICAADVVPPRVVWAKSFKIVEGQYNAVAYVENLNHTAATPALPYEITLYDESGKVIATRSGSTVLPPNSVYPIFAGQVFTEARAEATETKITLGAADMWLPATIGRDQFQSLDIALSNADVRPRLDVKLENTYVSDARDLEIVATIFNDQGEPVTASQTFEDYLPARTTMPLVFTWPNSIAKTVRSCIIPTDVVLGIDISGSMNNDGGDPPEPISAALTAAGDFTERLGSNDRVAVVTFATAALRTTALGRPAETLKQDIQSLVIAPEEETGYTNTAAALREAQTELNSERHNPDARRVLVLLTDGLPTAKGDADVVSEAVAAAQALDADGIEIYAIGLGEAVDRSFINQVASRPDTAFFAPTGADLARIYGEITTSLCESGPAKIDVIPKTNTNFAPLR